MSRVYNFSAGPAVLPEEVLREAAEEMLDYKGSGMSVMEMSHRSKVYDTIIKEAEQDIRDLMNIPDHYKVLFLQGGASQQFAMIPMNLMKNKKAGYIVTGQWAKKAYQEAQLYGEAIKLASSEDQTFSYIPDCSDLDIPEDLQIARIRFRNGERMLERFKNEWIPKENEFFLKYDIRRQSLIINNSICYKEEMKDLVTCRNNNR